MRMHKRILIFMLVALLSLFTLAGDGWTDTVELPHAFFEGFMATYLNGSDYGMPYDLEFIDSYIVGITYKDGSFASSPAEDPIIYSTVQITTTRYPAGVPGTSFNDATIVITDGITTYFSATLRDINFVTDGVQWFLNPELDVNVPSTLNLIDIQLDPNGSAYIMELAEQLGSNNIAGMQMTLDVFDGDITQDSFAFVQGLLDGVQSVSNTPPTALGGVTFNQDQCLGMECEVTLNGSESNDPDEGDFIVSYEWYENDLMIATGAISTVNLPLGWHEITLVVVDSNGAAGEVAMIVVVDPAELSFIEITKATVFWNYDWIKIKGKLALPAGVSHESVSSIGSATINLSGGLGDVVSDSVDFDERRNGRKWRYHNRNAGAGELRKFKIDWYGDKFYYHKDHLRINSHHFGDDTTTLEIEFCRKFAGPVDIEIGDVTVSIDAEDNVTVTGATEYDVDTHWQKTEIEVVMPFNMITDLTTFDINGTINDTVTIADYYTAAVGRFKIKAKFDSGGIDPESIDPKELLLDVRLGDEGFSGILVIENDTWRKTNHNKWKYKAAH